MKTTSLVMVTIILPQHLSDGSRKLWYNTQTKDCLRIKKIERDRQESERVERQGQTEIVQSKKDRQV